MERIITISNFRYIRSAFHPEAGKSAVGDKFHQLRYLTRRVNDAESKNFDLGTIDELDEVNTATHRRFFYVRQYYIEKPHK